MGILPNKKVILLLVILPVVIILYLTLSRQDNPKCDMRVITSLKELKTKNGIFSPIQEGWRIGPQSTTNRSLSQVFPLAYYPACDVREGSIHVDFKLIGGKEDEYAGIVFGLTSEGDYYAVRASGSENNVIIAKFKNGNRTKLKTIDNIKVSKQEWHTLKIDITSNAISVYIDKKPVIENYQVSISNGTVGVNTKSDAITEFRKLYIQSN